MGCSFKCGAPAVKVEMQIQKREEYINSAMDDATRDMRVMVTYNSESLEAISIFEE
mgnify:CR=1 FL=1